MVHIHITSTVNNIVTTCFISVPPYQPQSSVPVEDQGEAEMGRNVIDQSKAPGFRGNSKSPVVADTPTTSG